MNKVNYESESDIYRLKKDAMRGLWILILINLVVLITYLFDGFLNKFVFVVLLVQSLLFVFVLSPFVISQVWFKKQPFKIVLYRALAYYKYCVRHATW